MRKRIIIKGKVHGVGYRLFLYAIAESIELERFYVDNIYLDKEEAVEILIDDEESKIKDFINIINQKKPERAIVESIEVYDYKDNIMKRDAFYRYLTAMQLFKIANYGSSMLEKQDLMLEKLSSIQEDTKAIREAISNLPMLYSNIMEELNRIKLALKKAGIEI